MPRELTNANRTLLLQIARAQDAERKAKAAAIARAKELIDSAGLAERAETNRLVYEAIENQGLMKSVVAEIGLKTKDRHQVYQRLQECPRPSEERVDLVEGMTIREENGVFIVELKNFSHVDLGENLSGFVEFYADGEVEGQSEAFAADPLFAMKLWGLPEVQVQL